ncbi:MAG: formate--tetrahydrofolate ligase, partial [Planctomycetota bacterium]
SVLKKNPLNVDPFQIQWRRVVDVSDRMLRNIVIGLGGKNDGYPRESGFDITVASEVMAILALTTGADDLRKRLGRIVLGMTNLPGRKPVTCEDIKVAGSMAVLLKDAIKPNLMQTLEKGPAFVHAGPFANIAHGNSSILADMVALKAADYVVTESGFGADCGAEKFFNVKCRVSGLKPDAVVIVATIRALKMHSGEVDVVPGKPLPEALTTENLGLLKKGFVNLQKHIENMRLFGVPTVVAINKFLYDTDKEVELVKKMGADAGASVALSEVWEKGGEGGKELAEAVVKAAEEPSNFKLLYPDDMPIEDKLHTLATKIYGAKDISISP